jgi:prevent-host-death family protein
MKIIEMSNANGTLADYAKDVVREPVILTSNGKPVAALLSIDDVDLETISLSNNPEFLSIIEQSRAHLKAEGGISSGEMRRRLGLSPATK